MKKITFILAVSMILFGACSNSNKNQNNDDVVTATINNSKGETLDVTYNTKKETATIVLNGETIVLKQQPSASGIRYANEMYEYTEWQDEVELTKNGEVVFSNKETETSSTYSFVDTEGNAMDITYDTTGETPTATITYGDYKEIVLTQIPESAWAKGAEYANETMKWVTSADGGELTIDGKAIPFKAQP